MLDYRIFLKYSIIKRYIRKTKDDKEIIAKIIKYNPSNHKMHIAIQQIRKALSK